MYFHKPTKKKQNIKTLASYELWALIGGTAGRLRRGRATLPLGLSRGGAGCLGGIGTRPGEEDDDDDDDVVDDDDEVDDDFVAVKFVAVPGLEDRRGDWAWGARRGCSTRGVGASASGMSVRLGDDDGPSSRPSF